MVGWKDGRTDRQLDRQVVTLQGWSDDVGRSEGPADSGTDSCAVQGAATLMRPERTTGLRTRVHHGTNISVRTAGNKVEFS